MGASLAFFVELPGDFVHNISEVSLIVFYSIIVIQVIVRKTAK